MFIQALALFLMVSSTATFAANDIVVAQATALTGEGREMALDFVAGARAYFDHINSTGGIHGRRIDYLVRDDAGKADETAKITRSYVAGQHADVLFGYSNEAGIAAALRLPEVRQAQVAMFSPISGSDFPGAISPVIFTRASYADECRRIVEQYQRYGFTRYALLTSQAPFSDSAEAAIDAALKQAGLAVAVKRALPASGELSDADLKAIHAVNPQAIVVLSDTVPLALFLKRFRALNESAVVVGLSVVNHTTLLELAGANTAAGTVLTKVVPSPARTTNPVVREHLGMMKKFRDEPISHATLEGHLAAKALAQALRAAGRDTSRAAITAALRTPRRYDLDGVVMESIGSSNRLTAFADISLLRRDGSLAN